MGTGHVEKTNDRDYEVEERYAAGAILESCRIISYLRSFLSSCSFAILNDRPTNFDTDQTVSHNGIRREQITERSSRIS